MHSFDEWWCHWASKRHCSSSSSSSSARGAHSYGCRKWEEHLMGRDRLSAPKSLLKHSEFR